MDVSEQCLARHAGVDVFLGSAFRRSSASLPLTPPHTLGEYLLVALPASATLLLVIAYWGMPPAALVHPASRTEQCAVRLVAAATHAVAWCVITALVFQAVDVGLVCRVRSDDGGGGVEAASGPAAPAPLLLRPVGDDALRLLVVVVGASALLVHWVVPWRTVRCLNGWWLSLPALDSGATAGVLVADLMLRHAGEEAAVSCWPCAWARVLSPLQAALAAATACALVFARAPLGVASASASAWRRSSVGSSTSSSSLFSSSTARPRSATALAPAGGGIGARRTSRYDLHLPPFDTVGRDASRVIAS